MPANMITNTATTTYIFKWLRINPEEACSPCAAADKLSINDRKNGVIFLIVMTFLTVVI